MEIIFSVGKLLNEVLYQTPPKIAATLLAIFELTQGVRMDTGIFDITKLSAAMIGRERCNQINQRTPWLDGASFMNLKDNRVFVEKWSNFLAFTFLKSLFNKLFYGTRSQTPQCFRSLFA